MADDYDYQKRRGRYSKVDQPGPPSRHSFDHTYHSDSSSEGIDEFDPLNDKERGSPPRRRRKTTTARHRRAHSYPTNSLFSASRFRLQRWILPGRMCCTVLLVSTAALIMLLGVGGIWVYKASPRDGMSESWYPTPKGGQVKGWQGSYRRAAALVEQMTLVEKVNITTGTGWEMDPCVGNTGPVKRLGFPSLCLQDGPLGIRFADNITAFPAGITVGATWNRQLMYRRGRAHGLEARQKGINVILGPAMGPIGRMPAGGRNWEGFGSDPYLQGVAASETIKGIQDEGVIATAKHFVGNEQEHFRQGREWKIPNAISSNIDDRTLHEVYAWPFADSVRAGVASVMCSYNQVNNSYACGNSKLLNGLLKDELAFQGFVQSDWLAQRGGVSTALAGLDMSMPGDGLVWQDGKSLWGSQLTLAVLNGSVPMDRLNDMVTRIVAAWYYVGQDKWDEDFGPNFSSWTNDKMGLLHPGSDDKSVGVVNQFVNVQGNHNQLVRKIAAEGTVLLKNNGTLLPLSRKGWKKEEKEGKDMKFRVGVFGEDAVANPKGINSCKDRACNIGTLAMGWGSGAVELPFLVSPLEALKKNFDNQSVFVTDWPHNKLPDTQELFDDQDLCLVFASADAGEGYVAAGSIRGDRNDLKLQNGGDELIKNVAQKCGKGSGKTVVVIHSVGPVLMEDWINLPGVQAVLLANLPGEESGNSLADVLFGDVGPSGRLPYTIAKAEEDYGPGSKIMYYPNAPVPQQNFSDGLYIDYRYFDKHDIEPRFEFGFGLSYTTWELTSIHIQSKVSRRTLFPKSPPPPLDPPSIDETVPNPRTALYPSGFHKLKKYIYPYINSISEVKYGKYPYPPGYTVTPHERSPAGGAQGGNTDLWTVQAQVRVDLKNTGSVPGQTVVQLYISYPSGYVDDETGEPIDFPVKVLRGFEKVTVDAKQGTEITFDLTRRDLSYWCIRRQNWVMPTKGQFTVSVGFSSRNLTLKAFY